MTELSQRARALGERLLHLRVRGAAGPGMEEVGEVLLLCASELDRMAKEHIAQTMVAVLRAEKVKKP